MSAHRYLAGLAPLALAALSCTTAAPSGPAVSVSGSAISIDLGALAIPTGESLTCLGTGWITDRDYAIGSASAFQEEGGHHITMYWTTSRDPLPAHPCTDAEMASWNFIAGTGGEPGVGDDQSPPDGLAFRLPANAQVVIQVHYINTSGEARTVHDRVDIGLDDPSTIMSYANMFVVNDGAFEVPARTHFRRTTECVTTEPFEVVLLVGHMHSTGAHFTLDLMHTDGSSETLYDHTWEGLYVSHPPVIRWPVDAPLSLPVGTRIRQTCEWDNTRDIPATFPTEMCDGIFYYFPDTGEGLIPCEPTLVSEGVVP